MHDDAKIGDVRTTVNLEDDVAAGIEQLRRKKGLGLSEALNELARAGLKAGARPSVHEQRVRLKTRAMNLRMDVSNIAEALDIAEESGRS